MGHSHPITQVYKDNTIASGIAKDTTKQQLPHAMNMQYFWIRAQKP